MGKWTDILDAEIAAGGTLPSHIVALRFPRLDGWEPGRVWASWPVEADYLTPMGTLFGGYLAALADHAMASALLTLLDDNEILLTTDLQTNFFRPVRDGVLALEASVVSRSRRAAYCETHFKDSSDQLVARAGATQQILSQPPAG